MSVLLDTHAFVWWLQSSHRLGRRAHRMIARPSTLVYVSAASIWEIALKAARGKIIWKPTRLVPSLAGAISAAGFQELPVSAHDAADVARLPQHHHDPFDRLLIAQAMSAALRVVTADAMFDRYGVEIVDAAA